MKKELNVADCIQPLNMNGLNGRMLSMPAPKNQKREILVLYGHHALLERWWGLVQNLNELGAVTMPDLPGFGGMDSFRNIGQKPTLDNYADYMAAFIRMRYKKRRITIVGISFGFLVLTRMLQRYPDLAKRVDLVVSIVGFMHRDDFLFQPQKRKVFAICAKFFAFPPMALGIRYIGLNRFFIKWVYVRLPAGRRRFIAMQPEDFETMMDFEVELWQRNDVRTHWATTNEFLKLDNCKQQINLPVWHVAAKADHYFDNDIVEQHMKVVFSDYRKSIMNSPAHTPSIVGNKKEMAIMVPPALRRYLKASGKPR